MSAQTGKFGDDETLGFPLFARSTQDGNEGCPENSHALVSCTAFVLAGYEMPGLWF